MPNKDQNYLFAPSLDGPFNKGSPLFFRQALNTTFCTSKGKI